MSVTSDASQSGATRSKRQFWPVVLALTTGLAIGFSSGRILPKPVDGGEQVILPGPVGCAVMIIRVIR